MLPFGKALTPLYPSTWPQPLSATLDTIPHSMRFMYSVVIYLSSMMTMVMILVIMMLTMMILVIMMMTMMILVMMTIGNNDTVYLCVTSPCLVIMVLCHVKCWVQQ